MAWDECIDPYDESHEHQKRKQMQIQGTVVTVELGIEIPKLAGGVYQGSRLSYRDVAGALKEQCFTAQTLKYSPAVKVALSNLAPGEQFTMVKEKEGEYWNVKSIIAGAVIGEPLSPPKSTGASASKTFASPKSTYETPEERAKKQVYIVRQSSLSAAINLLAANGGKKNSVEEVIQTAKQFESYVFDTQNNGNEAADLNLMEDDIS